MAELPDRDKREAAFAAKLGKVSAAHRRELRDLLRERPDRDKLPQKYAEWSRKMDLFWERVEKETKDAMLATLLVVWMDSAILHGLDHGLAMEGGMTYSVEKASLVSRQMLETSKKWVGQAFDKAAQKASVATAKFKAEGGTATVVRQPDVLTNGDIIELTTKVFGPKRAVRLAEWQAVLAQNSGAKSAVRGSGKRLIAYWRHSELRPKHHSGAAHDPCPQCTPLEGRPWFEWEGEEPGLIHKSCDCFAEFYDPANRIFLTGSPAPAGLEDWAIEHGIDVEPMGPGRGPANPLGQLVGESVDDAWWDYAAHLRRIEPALTPAALLEATRDTSLRSRIAAAAAETDRHPSEAEIAAGNYRKGKFRLHGLEIAIENAKGSKRYGKTWQQVMANHYGYIKGEKKSDADGDHVDVFIGPDPESELAFVIDQTKPDGSFDEHKVMLGWHNQDEAEQAYLDNYPAGWDGLMDITPMTLPQLLAWINGDTSEAVSESLIEAGWEDVSRDSHGKWTSGMSGPWAKVMRIISKEIRETHGLSKSFSNVAGKKMQSIVRSLSPKAARMLSRNLEEIHFFETTKALTDRVYELSGGIVGTDTIQGIWGPSDAHDGRGGVWINGVTKAYSHELAHAIDWDVKKNQKISDSPEWKKAYKKEIRGKGYSPTLSRYAWIDPQEGWAEFGRLIYENPGKAQKKFPESFAVWKKHGFTPELTESLRESNDNGQALDDLFNDAKPSQQGKWMIDCVLPGISESLLENAWEDVPRDAHGHWTTAGNEGGGIAAANARQGRDMERALGPIRNDFEPEAEQQARFKTLHALPASDPMRRYELERMSATETRQWLDWQSNRIAASVARSPETARSLALATPAPPPGDDAQTWRQGYEQATRYMAHKSGGGHEYDAPSGVNPYMQSSTSANNWQQGWAQAMAGRPSAHVTTAPGARIPMNLEHVARVLQISQGLMSPQAILRAGNGKGGWGGINRMIARDIEMRGERSQFVRTPGFTFQYGLRGVHDGLVTAAAATPAPNPIAGVVNMHRLPANSRVIDDHTILVTARATPGQTRYLASAGYRYHGGGMWRSASTAAALAPPAVPVSPLPGHQLPLAFEPKKRFSGVSIENYQRTAVEENIKNMERVLGRGFTPQILGEMAGAPDHADVKIYTGYENSVKVRWTKPVTEADKTTPHLGVCVLKQIIDNARAAGFEKLTTHAARGSRVGSDPRQNRQEAGRFEEVMSATRTFKPGNKEVHCDIFTVRNQPMNGYYTWPRIGYDSPLYANWKRDNMERLSAIGMEHVTHVSELMKTKEGSDLWATWGDNLGDAEFDLRDGSRSMKVFTEYCRKNHITEGLRFNPTEWVAILEDVRPLHESQGHDELGVPIDFDSEIFDEIWERIRQEDELAESLLEWDESQVERDWHGRFGHGDDHAGMTKAIRLGKGKEAAVVYRSGEKVAHVSAAQVPPAWTDVHVSDDPKADVLVKARDAKGRLKTVYSDSFTMKQVAVKFARVSELMSKKNTIASQNQQNRKDPAQREAADCTFLILEQATRPGSDKDTGGNVKAYGATTLEARHVRQTPGGKVMLTFVGKEGVQHNHEIHNPELARMLLERKAGAASSKSRLFKVSDSQLREYVGKLDGGEFHPKDFRSALANEIAIAETNKIGPKTFASEKKYKAAVKDVAIRVSRVLGNKPSEAVASYINPTVWSIWQHSA